jgi:YD repeat-containing protein
VGRVIEATSGSKARGEADTDTRPYDLSYRYDEMSHLISSSGRVWENPHEANTGSGIYVNDKNTSWQYDVDGRLTSSGETQYRYDAAGLATSITGTQGNLQQTQDFDGDGRRTKLYSQQDRYNVEAGTTTTETKKQYFVISSVLNQVITELDQSGAKTRTFVYQGSQILAWQQQNGTTQAMAWEHRDISNASVRIPGATTITAAELEPLGMNAGVFHPIAPSPSAYRPPLKDARSYPGFADPATSQCQLDYIDLPCDMAMTMIRSGAGLSCPPEGCGPQAIDGKLEPLTVDPKTGRLVYGHWESTAGGVERDPSTGKVIETHAERPHFVVDGVAVTTTFFVLNIGDTSRERLTDQGTQQNIVPLGNLAQNVANRLTGDCGEFVKELYVTIAGKYPKYEPQSKNFNLLDVFNAINSRDGAIVLKENLIVGGAPAGGTVSGILGNPDYPATIYLNAISGRTPVGIGWAQQYGYAIGAIHETFHLAHKNGGYSDEEMAKAVFDLTGRPGLPKDGATVPEWSRYWNDALEDKCRERK